MARPARETPWFARRKGSQTFYAFWYDKEARETKRVSLGTQDPLEAQARFALFLSEGDALLRPNAGGLTVSQALRSYLIEHVRPNCADVRRQEASIGHLNDAFGDTALKQIDIPASRLYADRRRRENIKDSTIRRELGTLMAAANHALRWRRIPLADMPSIELTKAEVLSHDEEAPYFTREQIKQLFEAADSELRLYIELLYWTGARRESIAELERSQVDLPNKRLLLHKPGRKVTKKRRPIVPILPPMEPCLNALLEREPRRDRLFLLTGNAMFRRFQKLCRDLGLPHGRLHCLRHSRATHLLQDGVSLYSVARLLGDTVGTVERVYGHHSAEYLSQQLGQGAGLGLAA